MRLKFDIWEAIQQRIDRQWSQTVYTIGLKAVTQRLDDDLVI